MLINKLDWVKSHGVFRDFAWGRGVPDFQQVNVIYGGNGSGKTSLSSVLRRAADVPANRTLLSVTVEGNSTLGRDHRVFDRICVFSQGFVDENHDFQSETPTMTAVLTVGKRAVEAERELETLRTMYSGTEDRVREAQATVRAKSKALEEAKRVISRAVVGDLTKVGGIYQSANKYSIRTVEARLARYSNKGIRLTVPELQAAKEVALSGRPDFIARRPPTVGLSLLSKLRTAIATKPSTIVLQSLAIHPSATAWVHEGRDLHLGLGECIFCGSALTQDRKLQIDHHFSEAVSNLEKSLDEFAREVHRLVEDIRQIADPHRSDFYPDLRDKFDVAIRDRKAQIETISAWSRKVLKVIFEKRANVLGDVGAEIEDPVIPDWASVNALIDEHNRRVSEHEEMVVQEALRVELHHLETGSDLVSRSDAAFSDAQSKLRDAVGLLDRMRTRIAVLETVEGDPAPSAQKLTREVARLLGRDELTFSPVSEGRYSVARTDGSPAIGLSEGERTAISLIHFLETVGQKVSTGLNPIVVIDDPVSSLDSNVFVGISTYIWVECVTQKRASQLFILTHDFELFRQWDIQLDGVKSHGVSSHTYELRSIHRSDSAGRGVRHAELVSWPPSAATRGRVRSTYHHAFMTLADAKMSLAADDSVENRLNAQLLLPNVIRRMLESFLGFKQPTHMGDFSGAMRRCLDMLDKDGAAAAQKTRLHLTRFAHMYSHEESPDTSRVVPPDELLTTITQAFLFMSVLDSNHFDGLCEVTGYSRRDLLH